ncbi:MAG: cytochrome C oxidase subunit IV family protein [Bdellovibrionota bacterium]
MAATGAHDSAHHIIPRPTYFKVFAALIFLTVVTVAASRLDFGTMNTIVAFTIATIKAVLVASIFMHLKYDDRMNRLILFSALFFLVVFYFFCILDEATRVIQTTTM